MRGTALPDAEAVQGGFMEASAGVSERVLRGLCRGASSFSDVFSRSVALCLWGLDSLLFFGLLALERREAKYPTDISQRV